MKEEWNKHYKVMSMEPWLVMEAWSTREEFIGYLRLTALKYLSTRDKKGNCSLDDLRKAKEHITKLIEVEIKGGVDNVRTL